MGFQASGLRAEKIGYSSVADRLMLVEKALGNATAQPYRAVPRPPANLKPSKRLTFYYDFASPWTYLAATQVERVAAECNATVEYVPILLGALFKQLGGPDLPMSAMIEPKRAYFLQDLQDWQHWWSLKLVWPSVFPIRTVLPLRVAIVEPRVIQPVFKAAWADNKNIGDQTVLEEVLRSAGFDTEKLIKAADAQPVKDQLRANTERLFRVGGCGAPSFQVDDGDIIWGQDRLDVVMDLLCGWPHNTIRGAASSKL